MCDYYGCDCKHCRNNKDWKACKYVKGIPIYKDECFKSVCPEFKRQTEETKLLKLLDGIDKWFKTTFVKWQIKYYLIRCYLVYYIFNRE